MVSTPVIVGICFLWLKDKFPTKEGLQSATEEMTTKLASAEQALSDKIAGTEKTLSDKIDEHEERLDVGSRKMVDLDKRTALIEEDCKAMPSRQNLQAELSSLSQRMRGVEVRAEAIGDHLRTQNEYLHTLIERGLGGGK